MKVMLVPCTPISDRTYAAKQVTSVLEGFWTPSNELQMITFSSGVAVDHDDPLRSVPAPSAEVCGLFSSCVLLEAVEISNKQDCTLNYLFCR